MRIIAWICVLCIGWTTVAAPPTAAPSAAPASIDDIGVLISLQQRATKLVEDGKTTKMATLAGQLRRKSCRLQLPQPSRQAVSQEQFYERARGSVVVMGAVFKCGKCTKWHVSTASGFAIAPDVCVTNYHVVNSKNEETLVVMSADGRVLPVTQVLAASKVDDVAVVQVAGAAFTPLPLRAAAPVGSHVRVISHPDGQFYMLTEGIISRYMKLTDKGRAPAMAITADYAKGSSGAPVLDDSGAVVGLVASTRSIYYNNDNGRNEDLQMVVKQCVPASSVLKLIAK